MRGLRTETEILGSRHPVRELVHWLEKQQNISRKERGGERCKWLKLGLRRTEEEGWKRSAAKTSWATRKTRPAREHSYVPGLKLRGSGSGLHEVQLWSASRGSFHPRLGDQALMSQRSSPKLQQCVLYLQLN